VRLKKSGTQRYMGLCPSQRKDPSFTVHVVHQFYKCFSCGAGGDVVKFVMEKEGIGFYEALKLLAERYGIPCPNARSERRRGSKLRGALFQMHEMATARTSRQSRRAGRGRPARGYLARACGRAGKPPPNSGWLARDRSGRRCCR